MLVALSAGALVTGCVTPTLVAFDETWFECTRSRQCEILEDPSCSLLPINKRFAERYAQRVRVNEPARVVTGPCPAQRVRYRAVCAEGRCESALRGLVRTKPR